MNDQIKKMFLIGLGATIASKEKAERIFNDLEKNGNAASEETKLFFERLSEKGQSKKETLQEDVRSSIKESIQDLGFVTAEDYQELKEKVVKLETELDKLSGNSEQNE